MWDEAVADGLRVVTTYEACEEADLMVLPVTSTDDASVADAVLPNLVPGDVVVLQETAVLPDPVTPGVDVVRLAPWASGYVMRDEFAQGRGVPLSRRWSWTGRGAPGTSPSPTPAAIGATRAGVIRTTDEEYAKARAEAESTLMRGAVLPLVRAAFDSLVESGCQPEVAYLRCVYGLRLFAEALVRGGLDAELAAARTQPEGRRRRATRCRPRRCSSGP